MVPLLDDDVEIFDPGNCQEKLDEAFQKLQPGCSICVVFRGPKPEASLRGLRAFRLDAIKNDGCRRSSCKNNMGIKLKLMSYGT